MAKISSLLLLNSLFFFISLKSPFNPIEANGRLYSLCIRPGLGAITYNLSPRNSASSTEWVIRIIVFPVSFQIFKTKDFTSKREEILTMIWNMEEEIMGKEN